MPTSIARHARVGDGSPSRRRRGISLAVLVAALAAPASASAATLDVRDGVLRYAGAPGKQTRLQLDQSGPTEVRVTRQSNYGDTDPIAPGAACVPGVNPDVYLCAGVTAVHVELGDQLDGVGAYGLTSISARLEGGAGDDYLSGGRASDVLRGGDGADYLYAADGGNDVDAGAGDDEIFSDTGTDVLRGGDGFDSVEFSRTEDPAPTFSITLDGAANDGVAGENDLVASDIEDVKAGTADYAENPGTVSVSGDAATNVLRVDYGHGVISGGDGNDLVTGGPHDDLIDARDGFADRVSCGDGTDRALADAVDTVGSGCESVQRLPEPAVAVDDAPPTITFSHPGAGAVFAVGRGEALTAHATDDRGVEKVQFMLGDRLLCEDVSAPFTCGYTPSDGDVGNRTVVAIAIDSRQQTAVALRGIEVRAAAAPAAPVTPSAERLTLVAGAPTVGVPISCGTRDAISCTGTLTVEALLPRAVKSGTAQAARRGRRVTIARARFSTASGQQSTVKARVSRRGVRKVLRTSSGRKKQRTVSARITVALDGSGKVTRWRTRLTIRATARR